VNVINDDEFTRKSPPDVGRLIHVALERALSIQDAMVQKNIARARQRNSDATRAEVIRTLERMYLSTLARQGAAVGAVSAAPRDGAGAALAGGEVLSTLE